MARFVTIFCCATLGGCATQHPTYYAVQPSPAEIDDVKCKSHGHAPGTAAFGQCTATLEAERRQPAVAGALFRSGSRYQIVMGENQTIVWRLNTFSGELAVCTSPDLPGAGCRPVPEPKARETQTPPAASGAVLR